MDIELVIKNYRCFSDSSPARLSIRDGFTAFVGANNAGKSALLKFLYEMRPLFQTFRPSNSGFLSPALSGAGQGFNPSPSVLDHDDIFHDGNDRDLEIDWTVSGSPGTLIIYPPVGRVRITISRSRKWTAELYVAGQDEPITPKGVPQGDNVVQMTRVFEAADVLSRAMYIGPFRNALNVSSTEDYYDIRVGQAFINSWRDVKTGTAKKQNEAAFRLTQDIKNVFGFTSLEINASGDGRTLQLFVDGRSYKLSELGSGLSQFILVLANAALKQPSLILIDEPELNLHPTMQLDFLTTLASYAEHGVMFATHSLGLARSSADWIYSLRRNRGVSEVRVFEATPNLAEFVGELSFSGYRDLGFDQVLLVEGTTEVRTIQQFLRLAGKDHKVVILPLGGSSMIKESPEDALLEIKRISRNISALIDSERASATAPLDQQRQAFVDACARLDIRCHVLERRATENYLTDAAIRRVKGPKYRALLPHELLKTADPAWSKSENWKIAREMNLDDLVGTDLGEFIDTI